MNPRLLQKNLKQRGNRNLQGEYKNRNRLARADYQQVGQRAQRGAQDRNQGRDPQCFVVRGALPPLNETSLLLPSPSSPKRRAYLRSLGRDRVFPSYANEAGSFTSEDTRFS